MALFAKTSGEGWSFDKKTGQLTITGELPVDADDAFQALGKRIHSIVAVKGARVTFAPWLFAHLKNLKVADLAELDVTACESLDGMFQGCFSLTSVDLSGWDVRNVKSMMDMFECCESLVSLDLSTWDVRNVKIMSRMFCFCKSLKSIKTGPLWIPRLVEETFDMFGGCLSLRKIDLSAWHFGSLHGCGRMFCQCRSLEQLDLSSMDVGLVEEMPDMFAGCESLRSLWLEDWDLWYVKDMNNLFAGCGKLETLDLTGWRIPDNADTEDMFKGVPTSVQVIASDDSVVRLLPEGVKVELYPDTDAPEQVDHGSSACETADNNIEEYLLPKESGENDRLRIAVLGHIGHGKSTLTAAIPAVLARKYGSASAENDKLSRSPGGGNLAIESSAIDCETPDRHFTLIDYPGHADWVKRLLIEPHLFDGAILVVDAVEGPMPQTREHLLHARDIGLTPVAVFMNKLDLIEEDELLFLTEMEIRELLDEYGFDGKEVPVIKGSALNALKDPDGADGDRVLELMGALDAVPFPVSAREKPFLLAVEDIIEGKTAVTGRVECGAVKVGDTVELVGITDQVKHAAVTGISTLFREKVDSAEVGDNVQILLHGLQLKDLKKGQVLARTGSIAAHKSFEAVVYVLKQEEGGRHTPFFSGYRPQFYFRTSDATGIVRLPEGLEMVMPGDNIRITAELITPFAMERGTRFAIREGGRTVAMGTVTCTLD